jgi:hypothetical protein
VSVSFRPRKAIQVPPDYSLEWLQSHSRRSGEKTFGSAVNTIPTVIS